MIDLANIKMADPATFLTPSVRMVSYTTPCVDDLETPQQLIAYCARVSSPKNQNSHETADRLIRYLIRNKHWSPLEMVDVTMEIEIPRDIGRQILRHRSFTYQEFSQRYAEVMGFAAPREARMQDITNRQNSLPCVDVDLCAAWEEMQREVIEFCRDRYERALYLGIAKECARVVLPEGLTMSRMYMKGSIRSWIHYLDVRRDPTTQKEHRDLAVALALAIETIWSQPK
jgi:thymidylate synthase (FAD)